MRACCRVVLTRTPADNARLRSTLGEIAADVIDYPCIALESVPLTEEIAIRLRHSWYGAIVFVSRNAVEQLLSAGIDPPRAEIVAIGPSTAAELARWSWPVTAMPTEARVGAMVDEIDRLIRSTGPVLYVRGDIGEDALPDAIRSRHRSVDVAVVYKTLNPVAAPLEGDARPTLVVFASPSAVRNFHNANAAAPVEALAIGETTAHAAASLGLKTEVSPTPDVDGLATSIRRWVDALPVRNGATHA